MFMEASTIIQRANSVGMYNRQTASDLLNRATNAANLSQQYLGVSSRDLQLLSWHNHLLLTISMYTALNSGTRVMCGHNNYPTFIFIVGCD